jgi:hypothetical protein
LETDEKNIAICYFLKEGDDRYTGELTDRRLIIRREKKSNEFPIQGIRSLNINHRKLLVPIVFGGVFTPLIAVGYFEDFFHPVIAVTLMLAGILTFYLGWLGQQVLTVNEIQGHMDFPVEDPGENVKAFIEYTNQFIENEPLEFRSLYLLGERQSKKPEVIDPPVALYTYRQIREKLLSDPGTRDFVIWAIDPLKTGTEIKYERLQDDPGLRPVLKGKIKPEAVIRKYAKDEFMGISPENKIY